MSDDKPADEPLEDKPTEAVVEASKSDEKDEKPTDPDVRPAD